MTVYVDRLEMLGIEGALYVNWSAEPVAEVPLGVVTVTSTVPLPTSHCVASGSGRRSPPECWVRLVHGMWARSRQPNPGLHLTAAACSVFGVQAPRAAAGEQVVSPQNDNRPPRANRVSHGFLLSGGRYTPVDVPGAVSTEAFKINPDGTIVGNYTDAGGAVHGFLASRG
jgi:hypothetical protein